MQEEVQIVAASEDYVQPKSHSELMQNVEQFRSLTRANANLARRDREYYDGNQISSTAQTELAKRGQPPITNNKIAQAVSGLFGLIDASASSPEAWPRNAGSQNAADTCTKTLRYLSDSANYPKVRKLASENYLIQGTCAASIETDGQDINMARVRFEEFIFDPLSQEYDFCDAKFLGVGKLLDTADVKAMYPETYNMLGNPTGDNADFLDDQSKSRWWSSANRDRLRVIDLYYLIADEWHRAVFCDAGMLFAGPSDYHDDRGRSICPIVAVSLESNQNGDRYGIVRNMISLQDEVNARRSRLLHMTNHRQLQQVEIQTPGTSIDIARREAGKADGVIPYGFQAIQSTDIAQSQALLLTQTMTDLDRMAPTPAVLGRSGGAAESGRARQILQQSGNTETARVFGRFQDWETSVYRTLWSVAREHISAPTWIRILDDPRAPEFLQINEPVMGMVAKPALDPSTGQPLTDPTTGQPRVIMQPGVVATRNRLAEMDMDIIISQVPDAITLRHEIFAQIMDYAGSTGISPFDPKFLALIDLSGMPDKQATIDRIKRLTADTQEQGGEAQAAQMQVAMAKQESDLELQRAKTQKDQAHAEKATAEAERTTLENHAFVAAAAQHISQRYQPNQPL